MIVWSIKISIHIPSCTCSDWVHWLMPAPPSGPWHVQPPLLFHRDSNLPLNWNSSVCRIRLAVVCVHGKSSTCPSPWNVCILSSCIITRAPRSPISISSFIYYSFLPHTHTHMRARTSRRDKTALPHYPTIHWCFYPPLSASLHLRAAFSTLGSHFL